MSQQSLFEKIRDFFRIENIKDYVDKNFLKIIRRMLIAFVVIVVLIVLVFTLVKISISNRGKKIDYNSNSHEIADSSDYKNYNEMDFLDSNDFIFPQYRYNDIKNSYLLFYPKSKIESENLKKDDLSVIEKSFLERDCKLLIEKRKNEK